MSSIREMIGCPASRESIHRCRRCTERNFNSRGRPVSILSRRPVADAIALAFAAAINPAAKPGVRFPEINGDTVVVAIPTRHGDVAATVYYPQSPSTEPPAVYVNVHGGGFVVGHREQDDPWCRYLAAHANVMVVNTD